MHDLRHDPEETQHSLPAVAVPAKPAAAQDYATWMQTVDHRLVRLEESVKRIADGVQIMALERDGRGRG